MIYAVTNTSPLHSRLSFAPFLRYNNRLLCGEMSNTLDDHEQVEELDDPTTMVAFMQEMDAEQRTVIQQRDKRHKRYHELAKLSKTVVRPAFQLTARDMERICLQDNHFWMAIQPNGDIHVSVEEVLTTLALEHSQPTIPTNQEEVLGLIYNLLVEGGFSPEAEPLIEAWGQKVIHWKKDIKNQRYKNTDSSTSTTTNPDVSGSTSTASQLPPSGHARNLLNNLLSADNHAPQPNPQPITSSSSSMPPAATQPIRLGKTVNVHMLTKYTKDNVKKLGDELHQAMVNNQPVIRESLFTPGITATIAMAFVGKGYITNTKDTSWLHWDIPTLMLRLRELVDPRVTTDPHGVQEAVKLIKAIKSSFTVDDTEIAFNIQIEINTALAEVNAEAKNDGQFHGLTKPLRDAINTIFRRTRFGQGVLSVLQTKTLDKWKQETDFTIEAYWQAMVNAYNFSVQSNADHYTIFGHENESQQTQQRQPTTTTTTTRQDNHLNNFNEGHGRKRQAPWNQSRQQYQHQQREQYQPPGRGFDIPQGGGRHGGGRHSGGRQGGGRHGGRGHPYSTKTTNHNHHDHETEQSTGTTGLHI